MTLSSPPAGWTRQASQHLAALCLSVAAVCFTAASGSPALCFVCSSPGPLQHRRRQHANLDMVSSAVAGIAQAGQNSLDAVARSSGAAENLRRHASELERALAAFKVELAN